MTQGKAFSAGWNVPVWTSRPREGGREGGSIWWADEGIPGEAADPLPAPLYMKGHMAAILEGLSREI